MTDPITLSKVFDLNKTGDPFVIPVSGRNSATAQLSVDSGSIGSAVLTLYKSNRTDAPSTALTSIGTASAGVSSELDVSGYAFIVAQVTTAAGSAAFGTLTIHAEQVP